jgi:hypothetical protein
MEFNTKGKKLIGKGVFSNVYDNEDGTVLIKTDDYSKECYALFCQNKHIPKTEIIAYNLYRQPKYKKIKSVSTIKSWKALRKIQKDYAAPYKHSYKHYDYEGLISSIEKYKNELEAGIYEALIALVEAYCNYTENIGFDVAKRNLALDNENNLILLDLVFDLKTLGKIRKKQVIR